MTEIGTRWSTSPENQSRRSVRADCRARRVGLERVFLQWLRPAVRKPARLERPSRSPEPRGSRLSAMAPRCDPSGQRCGGPPATRRVHGALLPAGRRVRRRHVECDATQENRSPGRWRDPTYVEKPDQRQGHATFHGCGRGSTRTLSGTAIRSPSRWGPKPINGARRRRASWGFSAEKPGRRRSSGRRRLQRHLQAIKIIRRSFTTATARRSAIRHCSGGATRIHARGVRGAATNRTLTIVSCGAFRDDASAAGISLAVGPWLWQFGQRAIPVIDVTVAASAYRSLPAQSITLLVVALEGRRRPAD